jgi:hypothetical protein
MRIYLSKKRNQAMDIVDLLVLIAVIAILAVMILLSVKRVHSREHQHTNLSFHILESARDYKYLMTISVARPPEFRNGTIAVNSPSRFP